MLSTTHQPRVFRKLRLRLARNALRVALESGRLRFFTMLLTSAIVATFTFAVGWYLFHQLAVKQKIAPEGIDLVFRHCACA